MANAIEPVVSDVLAKQEKDIAMNLKAHVDALFARVEQKLRELRSCEDPAGMFHRTERATVSIICHRPDGRTFYAGGVDLLPGEEFEIRQDHMLEPTKFTHWTLVGPPDAEVIRRGEGFGLSGAVYPGTRSGVFYKEHPGYIRLPQIWVVRRKAADGK